MLLHFFVLNSSKSVHFQVWIRFWITFHFWKHLNLRFLCSLFLSAVICWSDFCKASVVCVLQEQFRHLTYVILLNANCSYLSVIPYDQMKGCGFEGYTAHFTLLAERERESWIKLPSTQLSLSEIHIFLCSVSTICWRCWLLVSMQTLLREGSLHLLFFANLLKPVISR